MYIAMNRFQVRKGSEADFEALWTTRDTHLQGVPGFVAFHLLRGAEAEDHTLFSSHSLWASEAAFLDWTRSEAFRLAHKDARAHADLYLGPPKFEGFHVRQEITAGAA
jgi:heme-degrading monooxygenase HmoA